MKVTPDTQLTDERVKALIASLDQVWADKGHRPDWIYVDDPDYHFWQFIVAWCDNSDRLRQEAEAAELKSQIGAELPTNLAIFLRQEILLPLTELAGRIEGQNAVIEEQRRAIAVLDSNLRAARNDLAATLQSMPRNGAG